MSWKVYGHELPDPLRYVNPDTGEVRKREGGFTTLVEDHDQAVELLYQIAGALGPDVARRWQDRGPESVDLAAEVAKLREIAEDIEAAQRAVERGWARRSGGIEPATPAQRAAQAEAYRRLAEDPEAD